MYSSTLSLTSALDGVGDQRHSPAALQPRKNRYPMYRAQGRPQNRSGQVRKISPPNGIRLPDRPARSQLLYQLCYPVHVVNNKKMEYTEVAVSKTTTISGQSVGV